MGYLDKALEAIRKQGVPSELLSADRIHLRRSGRRTDRVLSVGSRRIGLDRNGCSPWRMISTGQHWHRMRRG